LEPLPEKRRYFSSFLLLAGKFILLVLPVKIMFYLWHHGCTKEAAAKRTMRRASGSDQNSGR
jgi:hypothetical protein